MRFNLQPAEKSGEAWCSKEKVREQYAKAKATFGEPSNLGREVVSSFCLESYSPFQG
jgi:hypothetical protein